MEYAQVVSPHCHWHWIVPFLLMILMFVFATRMRRRMGAWQCGAGRSCRGWPGCWDPGPESPTQIPDSRSSTGEITHEQVEQTRRDIASSSSNPGSRDNS